LTPYTTPGWSFYDSFAQDPSQNDKFNNALKKINGPWGAVEWALLKRNPKLKVYDQWFGALSNTLSYPGCRLLSIYNWEGISGRPEVIRAVRDVLHNEKPKSR
jgi:hypothetical protein